MLDWLNEPVLGSTVIVRDLLIALGILLIGVALSIFFPKIISTNITRIFANMEIRSIRKKIDRGWKPRIDDKETIELRFRKTIEAPLIKALRGLYLLTFGVIAILSIGIDMSTRFQAFERTYEAWRLFSFSIVLITILVLSVYAVDPIARVLIYNLSGERLQRTRKYSLFRAVRVPLRLTFFLVSGQLAFFLLFKPHQRDLGHVDVYGILVFSIISKVLLFVLLLLVTYLLAQFLVSFLEPRFGDGPEHVRRAGRSIGRLLKVGIYVIGFFISLTILGIPLTWVFSSSVLLGIILGFGLQDTIANFASGIMIAVDKPFVIGDRIRLNWGGIDTWGDVKDISLRSTWIVTPEEETIIIPNSQLAMSQVWNFTRDSPRVALHFDVGVSYDTDWKLAEKLMVDIMKAHPLVLKSPPPYVLMKEFAESSQILTCWFWIPEARDKLVIQSDLMKRIKDSFDQNGIEIPFPYRMMVYKQDMPQPKKLMERYDSPMYLPSKDFEKFENGSVKDEGLIRPNSVVLAPTSSSYPAEFTAPYVMETAKKMGASVTALFIKTPGRSAADGQKALRIYHQKARDFGVDLKPIYREGDVLENILESVESEKASIVIMGSSEETLFGTLTKRSISQELLLHLNIPTMIIPFKKSKGIRAKREQRQGVKEPKVCDVYEPEAADFGSLEKLENLGCAPGTVPKE